MDIQTTVKGGLPCIARATSYSPGFASKTNAEVDDCFEGEPEEVEFELLTLRGKPSPWIQKIATEADLTRIENEILESIKEYA